MKNLKKVLALVLVVVMAFSLVTLASAKTSFTDDKDIKYSTAVGFMSGIGAINGYTDGTFAPKGEVTRAEAAKMVAYSILGANVAAALKTGTTSFSDVPATHWASPYIEYCVAHGILNGRGDGTFDPNGKVTAFELAKMMLCAAGYGKNDEYVGPNWSINVASDGMTKNVFKGNETANFATAATREEAALYIFNGIYRVKQAEYNEMFGYYPKNGSVTTDWDSTVVKTIAQDTYKLKTVTGLVLGGSVTDAGVTGTNVSVATLDDQTGKVTKFDASATNYKFEATPADMGQLVDIYVNDSNQKVYYTETVSKAVVAFAAATSPTTFNNTFGSLTFNAACDVYTFTSNYASNTLKDGTASTRPTWDYTDDYGTKTTFSVGQTAPAGTYATYEGEIVSYAAPATTLFDKVAAISTSKGAESITFTGGLQLTNTAANDRITEYKDIAVGDYVTLKQIGNKYAADKVTTVSGTISQIRNFSIFGEWYITLDGKEYTKVMTKGTADLGATTFPSVTDFSKNTYTLYLDANGNWITCQLKSGSNASSVVYVTGPSWAASSDYGSVQKVQAVNKAGDMVVYTLASGSISSHGFYNVTINSTTGLATLDLLVSADTTRTSPTFKNVTPSAGVTVKANDVNNQPYFYYAPDVKFIFVSGSGADLKITTVTGLASVADITLDSTDLLYVTPSTTDNKMINTVIVTDMYRGGTTASTMYVDLDNVRDSYDGAKSYWNVYIDGVMTKIAAKDADLTNVDGALTSVVGKFASYTVDSNNLYDITGTSQANNVYSTWMVNKGSVYNNYFTATDGTNTFTFNATGATVIDLAQPFGEPTQYTSVAALAAASANKAFLLSFVKDSVTGLVKYIYVEKAFDLVAMNGNLIAGATKAIVGDTYTIELFGSMALGNAATVTITNGTMTNFNATWLGWGCTNTTTTATFPFTAHATTTFTATGTPTLSVSVAPIVH